jgi:hypothetical protein
MDDLVKSSISAKVTEKQKAEFHGDLWLPPVVLAPVLVYAAATANLPAVALLGVCGVVSVVIALRRRREPEKHLGRYTGPIADAVLRAGKLETDETEDPLSFRLRVIDTIDALTPRPLSVGSLTRLIGLALAFTAGLAGVGLLASSSASTIIPPALFGAVFGVVSTEWPRRRKAAKARALLEAQLSRIPPAPESAPESAH